MLPCEIDPKKKLQHCSKWNPSFGTRQTIYKCENALSIKVCPLCRLQKWIALW